MLKIFVPGRLCLFGEHTDWAGHYRTMNADIMPGAAIVPALPVICWNGTRSEVSVSGLRT